jgi:hypothetical protein
MPSLNQVTTKCCIWKNYNYYIMIILLPNKYKSMHPIFKLSWKVFMCHFMVTMPRIDTIHLAHSVAFSFTEDVSFSWGRGAVQFRGSAARGPGRRLLPTTNPGLRRVIWNTFILLLKTRTSIFLAASEQHCNFADLLPIIPYSSVQSHSVNIGHAMALGVVHFRVPKD